MRVLGRAPAAQGIFEVASMGQAIATLEAAVAAEEATGNGRPADSAADSSAEGSNEAAGGAVSLRRRVWPLVEMLRRAKDAGEPVVWGV